MKNPILTVALAAAFALPLHADPDDCGPEGCRTNFRLASTSDRSSYGVLIAAPESGCHKVRFRVESEEAAFLGHTLALGPGELGLVRMGRGFSPGDHRLTILAEGCAALPAATRRVTFAKLSPDHGWRAAH